MWSYEGKRIFFSGILLSFFAASAVIVPSLLESGARAAEALWHAYLPGRLAVYEPSAPDPLSALLGEATIDPPPLKDAPLLSSFLHENPAVGRVFSFSFGRVLLRSDRPDLERVTEMRAVGIDADQAAEYGLRFTLASGALPDGAAPWVLLPADWAGDRYRSGFDELFLDRPAAPDTFNLTAVTVAGTYLPADLPFPASPQNICIVARESLFRAGWRSFASLISQNPADLTEKSRPGFSPPVTIREAGTPLSLETLFSFPAAWPDGSTPPVTVRKAFPSAAPQYLLLEPAAGSMRSLARLCDDLNAGFQHLKVSARAVLRPADVAFPAAFLPGAGCVLALIVLAANLLLKAVPSDALVNAALHNPGRVFPKAGRFIGKNFILALFFSAAGGIPALLAIALYDTFAGVSEQAALARVVGLPLGHIQPALFSLIALMALPALFALTATPVPLFRLRRFLFRLTREARKKD
ncbi:MAG TPA: hypothetical protein ENN69_08965 [Spirochaetia bacterium]|nr:hypothetical protein [Spirochaetia bacterium]